MLEEVNLILKKNIFTLSKNVYQELNLNYLQICTFSIVIYIVLALADGISSKGVTMLYSTMSIYIAVFGLYALHNAKNRINSVDREKFKSKFDDKNINIEESIQKVKCFIFLVNLVLWVLLIINSTIMIISILFVINGLWIASFSLLFISFLGQSSIILIDKLVDKD